MSWSDLETEFKDAQDRNSLFVKIKDDGHKVVGVFVGNPVTFSVHRDGAFGSPTTRCAGPGCPECARGKRRTIRFKSNFYCLATETLKIFEGGPRLFQSVLPAIKKFGQDYVYEVTRRGRAGDPRTTYVCMPEEPVSQELKARLSRMPLHDLDRLASTDGGSDGAGATARPEPTDDVPF
jgi:hypothetical protein